MKTLRMAASVVAALLVVLMIVTSHRGPDLQVWDESLGVSEGTALVLVLEPMQVAACNKFLDDFREYVSGPRRGQVPEDLALHVMAVTSGEEEVSDYVSRYFARMRLPAVVKEVARGSVGAAVPSVPLPAVFLLRDGEVRWHQTVTPATTLSDMLAAI